MQTCEPVASRNCPALDTTCLLIMKTVIASLLVASLSAPSSFAQTQEHARLTYRTLCELAQLDFTSIDAVIGQSIRLSTRSQFPSVKTQDIKVTLHTQSGDRQLDLNSDGLFDLSVNHALLQENPWITTNQPKGSMILTASISVTLTPERLSYNKQDGRIRYAKLFVQAAVVERAEVIADKLSESYTTRLTVRRPKAIHLKASNNAATARVAIFQDGNEAPVQPLRPGIFTIAYDPKLIETNPWVILSKYHDWTFHLETEPPRQELFQRPTKAEQRDQPKPR